MRYEHCFCPTTMHQLVRATEALAPHDSLLVSISGFTEPMPMRKDGHLDYSKIMKVAKEHGTHISIEYPLHGQPSHFFKIIGS